MNNQGFPPSPDELITESDVEQKLLWSLLVGSVPMAAGIPSSCISTKRNIRKLEIDKGTSAKIYYPDYIACIIGMPILIVEAKAPEIQDLGAAMREARLYATELNALYPRDINPCQYCVVSNGHVTELRSWDSDAILESFELSHIGSSSPRYVNFCRHITYAKLREGAETIHARFRPRRYSRAVNDVGGTAARDEKVEVNQFGKLLHSEFQNLFNPSTLEDRERIVKNAYIPSKRRERYFDEIDHIIKSSAPPTVKEAEMIEDTSAPTEILYKFSDPQQLRNKILLLVGAVGAGKSTFVDHLQNVSLTDEMKQRTAWLRIDLNEAPVTRDEIYTWCRRHLMDGIRDSSPDLDVTSLAALKKLYKPDVDGFLRGEGSLFPEGSEEHSRRLADLLTSLKKDQQVTLLALERYLCTGRGRLLVVSLDNCDKRNRDEQLLMFEVAKWMQQEVRCLIILPIRQETFENHRHEPPLDTALKDLVYRIEAPPFQKVLSARLKLVVSEARTSSRTLRYKISNATVEFPVEKLERFLSLMMGSLFNDRKYGRNIIVGLAGWDIRRAFEIFLDFCRSGYIDADEIFQSQATGEITFLSRGTISRVLLRTDKRFYSGDSSYVKNLFQCDPQSPAPDSLIRYKILAWLRNHKPDTLHTAIKGFHRMGDVVKALAAHGSDEASVREQCQYLTRARCIISEHLRTDVLVDDDLIAITPAGHVHLDLAHGDVHYISTCAEDAWIADERLSAQIVRRISMTPYRKALSWPVVLDTAFDFVEYLRSQEKNSPTAQSFFLEKDDRDDYALNLGAIAQDISTEKLRSEARNKVLRKC